MKIKALIILGLIIAGVTAFMAACGSNPTSPTNTPTTTPMPTNTPTPSGPTNTSTITWTPTITRTPTITNTPGGPTDTFTNTPTITNTPTVGCGATNTPTPTPNTGNTLTGSITFTGTVSSSNPLEVEVFVPNGGEPHTALVTSGTNPYPYTVGGLSAGTTYVTALIYNAQGDGSVNAHIGDAGAFFGTNSCLFSAATKWAAVSGAVVQNISISSSKQFYGVGGALSYTGTRGTVSGCNQLLVSLFSDSTYSTNIGDFQGNSSNGARYDALPYKSSTDFCSSQTVYVLAYFDVTGYHGPVTTGDPYVKLGAISTSATYPVTNISFGDAYIWP